MTDQRPKCWPSIYTTLKISCQKHWRWRSAAQEEQFEGTAGLQLLAFQQILCPDAGSRVVYRLQRWHSIQPAADQRFMFVGLIWCV